MNDSPATPTEQTPTNTAESEPACPDTGLLRPAAPRYKTWEEIVGPCLTEREACKLLEATSSDLQALRDSHLIFGMLSGRRFKWFGRRTRWYPAWQFDRDSASVRSVVERILAAFREHLREVDLLLVATWATSRQWEDLDGETPSRWIEAGRDEEWVVESAHRAATWLGQ